MERAGGWYWYDSKEKDLLIPEKCGKWMHFFTDQDFAKTICEKAIIDKVCYECKCSDMEIHQKNGKGVICFYLNGDDIEGHRRVLTFMLENNMIEKTRTGRLHNISFKYDYQTYAGEYGEQFKAQIKLEDFLVERFLYR